MVSMSFGRGGAAPAKSIADKEDRYLGWLFIAPALIVVVTFIVGPILYAAWVSLHDWDTVIHDITESKSSALIGAQWSEGMEA